MTEAIFWLSIMGITFFSIVIYFILDAIRIFKQYSSGEPPWIEREVKKRAKEIKKRIYDK